MHDISLERLVGNLTESYNRQLDLYRRLTTLGQRILGQLSLSRGDLSRVMPLFQEKQQLLEQISTARAQSQKESQVWQETKSSAGHQPGAQALNAVLNDTQQAIQRFLSTEDQVKHYLEHLMSSGEKTANE
ncbi:MAG: hypothetical protein ACOCW2_03210 [Chitinivibrionales bacterium]